MSGSHSSHGAEQPSRSPRCTSFEAAPIPNNNSQNSVSSLQAFGHHVTPISMPNPDRICYSNKESAKVNIGLGCSGRYEQNVGSGDTVGPFCTNKPAVDIDFSQLLIPAAAPEPKPTTEALVVRLLHPPPHAFLYRNLSIQWIIGAVGQQHIEFRESDERYVIAQESELRSRGTALGMPAVYMEWLCGNDKETSATEHGVHLTPEYFDEVTLD